MPTGTESDGFFVTNISTLGRNFFVATNPMATYLRLSSSSSPPKVGIEYCSYKVNLRCHTFPTYDDYNTSYDEPVVQSVNRKKIDLFRDGFDGSIGFFLRDHLSSLGVSLPHEEEQSLLQEIISDARSSDNILVTIVDFEVQNLEYDTMERVFGTENVTIDDIFLQMRRTNTESCAICMVDFEVGMEATKLPCLHLYHRDCINKWLQMNPSCPLCRFRLSNL
ncbi:RING/U-box superfamily protein [Quillaja saponaria]|uniref:RING/U-box superfamily protein n=1 Tax=Quillaja saponaria TaxID=32244 RepID=A0AAD7PH93_QUISA|nr:RING/U-box superfamily protein [Quillaja saponaria]